MTGNWCNLRRPMELHAGEHAAYVKTIAALGPPEVAPCPHDLHPQTIRWMNHYGIQLEELDEWNRIRRCRQYSAREAAEIIIRSRKGRA